MASWEYRVFDTEHATCQECQDRLNALGRAGWELAAVDFQRWYLKRLLPPPRHSMEGWE